MKRFLLLVLFVNLQANPLSNDIANNNIMGSISSGIDFIDGIFNKMDNISQGTLTKCYPTKKIPEEKQDICSMLPKIEYVSIDVCSAFPGGSKSSNTVFLGDDYLKEFCKNKTSNKTDGGGVIASTNTGSKEVGGSKNGKYNGGNTPTQHYGSGGAGNIKNVLQDNNLANTVFLKGDQESLNLIDQISKDTGKKISEITIQDVTNLAPATKKDYLDERELMVESLITDIKNFSPYNVSTTLEIKLQGKQGLVAKQEKDRYIDEIMPLIDAQTQLRASFALDRARNEKDLVYPTREYIELLRQDQRATETVRVQKQMKKEVEIIKNIYLEDDKRKNLIFLTAEKAVIMNEKFDRNAAKTEIENLIR